jgi:hypothetical protein
MTAVGRRQRAIGFVGSVFGITVLGAIGWFVSSSSRSHTTHKTAQHGSEIVRKTIVTVSESSHWPWAIALAAIGLAAVFLLGGVHVQEELDRHRGDDDLTLEWFAVQLSWGYLDLRNYEHDHSLHEALRGNFVKASTDAEAAEANDRLDESAARLKRDRARCSKWQKDIEARLKEKIGYPTASLFRTHAVTPKRLCPPDLVNDSTWAEMAASVQWLADWLAGHTQGATS